MAAKYHVSSGPNTPLSHRYTKDDARIIVESTALPTGACNFTNLSAAAGGGSAPRCGCKRYWDKALGHPDGKTVKTGFCMCEHHACFHDREPEGAYPSQVSDGQRIIQQVPFRTESSGGNLVQETHPNRRALLESQLPDTLRWSRSIQSGPPEGLPAIPSQCLIPSDNGSGTSGSQTRYLRPFGGLGLETLGNIPENGPVSVVPPTRDGPSTENTRALQVYEDANGDAFLQSITEAATPSARASQDNDAEIAKNISDAQHILGKAAEENRQSAESLKKCKEGKSCSQVLIKQSDSVPVMESVPIANEQDDSWIPKLRTVIGHISKYPSAVEAHERRLDLLENASFTHPAIEDLQEGHDIMDVRVGELEGRLEELEKIQAAQNDASSAGSQRHAAPSVDSRISRASSAMVVAAMHGADSSRVEALEAQVAELQASAPPSHVRPWELEVVFLPFGSDLMGIWTSSNSAAQRSRGNSTITDEWTQAQSSSLAAAQASLSAHDYIPTWEKSASGFAPEGEDPSWLMARACKIRSRVDERLRSRGLVKLIHICGPDARDVQVALMSAFGDLPGLIAEDPFTQREDVENKGATPSFLSKYLGLQASWIPLRKLHKDSSLRLLNPSEMLTPALWTAQFLTSSVAMRTSGTRRLFVTQRDSYIQHLGETTDWTWKKMRQLPRVYSDQPGYDHTPEADAHEPCWEFDERLDPPSQSMHSSFASHISSLSIRSLPHELASPSNQSLSGADSPNASSTSTPVAPAPDISHSPLKERNPFLSMHTRTASMPSLVAIKHSPSQSGKRRIASFDYETQSSPSRAAPSMLNLTLKRRRISRSPSRLHDTPRWSVGPPSPYNFVDDIAERNKRGTTPFAYATPHSNAPYIDPRSRSDVDIEIYQDEYDDDELGSATDELDLGVSESGGWEHNALSDYEPEGSSPDVSGQSDGFQARQLDDEWEGVQDVGDESRLPGSFGSMQVKEGGDADFDREDAQSDASSGPSEYPSTQHELYSRSKTGFKIHVDEEANNAT